MPPLIQLRTANRKALTVYLVTIFASILFIGGGHLLVCNRSSLLNEPERVDIVTARVEAVLSRTVDTTALSGSASLRSMLIKFKARILDGEYKGLSVLAMQQTDNVSPTHLAEVSSGDKVLLYRLEAPEEGIQWSLHEYQRTDGLMALGIAFMALLLLFGRGKGLSTIISLAFTCMAIFVVFIPSILAGYNIYVSTLTICLFIVVMTILLVNGCNAKGFAAGAGCLGGLAAAGLLTVIMGYLLRLTGVVDEESIYLLFINSERTIDLKGIIFASIVIGALGATLDVSVSIASSLSEICETAAQPGFGTIIRSGINIGRDILGTMSNTLILAYTGSSLSMALLLITYSNSLLQLLNRELIVVEILQALVGSIGLLITIPLTSVICAFVYTGRRPVRTKRTGQEERQQNSTPSEHLPADAGAPPLA
jgi:uncharacterized membrane protein